MNDDLVLAASSRLEDALLGMNRAAIRTELARVQTELGLSAFDIADRVVSPALCHIGDEWERGAVALSQVYMSARLMEEAMAGWLEPGSRVVRGPRIGIAVLEDFHALGKRVVQLLLASAGHDVVDLGTGVSPDELVRRVATERVQLLMVSVLMFNKALHVEHVVRKLHEQGLDHVRVVVGGAPFVLDPELWRRIGAHAGGRSAGDALRFAAAFDGGDA